MTITLTIRPELETELARKALLEGSTLETYAAELLEDAIHLSVPDGPAPTDSLEDVFAKVRGLMTDDEIETLLSRNRSLSRQINFE